MIRIDVQRVLQRWGRSLCRPRVPLSLSAPPPRKVVPLDHQAAAQGLVDRAKVDSIAYQNKTLQTSREGVEPDLLDFSLAFQKELRRRGMPFYAHTYVRSGEAQNLLYRQGVTKAKSGQSPHNWGMAVDIVHYGRYWDLTNKEWSVVGLIGKEVARRRNIKITWGGDWKFYDPAHWELADWKKRVAKNEPSASIEFAEAFANARKKGVGEFTWRGKRYSTDLA